MEGLEKEKAAGLAGTEFLQKESKNRTSILEELHKKEIEALQTSLKAVEKDKEEVSDELTQSRAMGELYQIQCEEQSLEIEELKTVVFELKSESQEMRRQQEEKLRQMRIQYEENRALEAEEASKKLVQYQQFMEKERGEIKAQGEREVAFVREQCAEQTASLKRMNEERSEEMVAQIEQMKQQVNSLLEDKETLKKQLLTAKELQLRSEHEISSLLTSTSAQNEAIRALKRSIELGKNEGRLQFEFESETRLELQKEKTERMQTLARYEQLQVVMASQEREILDLRGALRAAEMDGSRLSGESKELTFKAAMVEEVSRENERLKGSLKALEQEMAVLSRSKDSLVNEVVDAEAEVRALKAQMRSKEEAFERTQLEIGSLRTNFAAKEKELEMIEEESRKLQRSQESLAAEVTELRLALERERSLNMNGQRSSEDVQREAQSAARLAWKIFRQSVVAMDEWHKTLTIFLEGEGANKTSFIASFSSPFRPEHSFSSSSSSYTPAKSLETASQLTVEEGERMMEQLAGAVQSISSLIGRCHRVRGLFESSVQSIVTRAKTDGEAMLDKILLLGVKAEALQRKLDSVQAMVERDQRFLHQEGTTLSELKQMLTREQNVRNLEAEQRVESLSCKAEAAKVELAEAKARYTQLESEFSLLKDENESLRFELQRYAETERLVLELNGRTDSLVETNQRLTQEVERKEEQVNRLRSFLDSDRKERVGKEEEGKQLQQQMIIFKNEVEMWQRKVQSLETEITRLKRREIDPDLERALIESTLALHSSILPSSPTTATDYKQRVVANTLHEEGEEKDEEEGDRVVYRKPQHYDHLHGAVAAGPLPQVHSSHHHQRSSGDREGIVDHTVWDDDVRSRTSGHQRTAVPEEGSSPSRRLFSPRSQIVPNPPPSSVRASTSSSFTPPQYIIAASPLRPPTSSQSRISRLGANLSKLASKLDLIDRHRGGNMKSTGITLVTPTYQLDQLYYR